MLSTSAWRLASMMLSLTPTVPHSRLPSVDWMSTRVLARGAGGGVEDAHLVIGQRHLLELRKEFHQRRAQRAVERVHRAVAFGHRVRDLARRRAPCTVASQIGFLAVAAHGDVIGVHARTAVRGA